METMNQNTSAFNDKFHQMKKMLKDIHSTESKLDGDQYHKQLEEITFMKLEIFSNTINQSINQLIN